MKKRILALLAGAILMMATSAMATPTVNLNGQTFIGPSSGSSDGVKINIIDFITQGMLGDGDHTYNLVNDTTQSWFTSGAQSVMVAEIAGYSETNTFGYYLTSNNAVHNELFAGSASAGASITFSIDPSANLGFYIGVPQGGNNTFFTQTSLNIDSGIHSAIFQVDNSNTYILGFEDLLLSSSDKDYQDMILKVTVNSAPVPEPGTMMLLGMGMLGLAVYGKRRMNKEA